MAGKTLKTTQSDSELGDLLRCPICQEVCDQPRILSCQHIVCTDCINNWIEAKKGQLWCPECNQQRELPQGGAESLPHSFRLNNICGILREKSETEEDRYICNLHGQALNKICFECEKTVCASCCQLNHSDHFCAEGKEMIEHTAKKKEDGIKSSLIRINQLEQELHKNREDGRNVLKDFKQRFEFAYHHLMQEMEKVNEEKTKALERQRKDLENYRDGLKEICNTSRNQENIDVDVAVEQMKSLPKDDILRPKATSLLKVEIDDQVLKMLFSDGETKCGKVTTSGVTDPSKSSIAVVSEDVVAGRPVDLQVVLKDGQGRRVTTERSEVLSVRLSTVRGQTISLEAKKTEDGCFKVSFTPDFPGWHIVKAWFYEIMISRPSLDIKVGPRWIENPKICGNVPFAQPHDVLTVGENLLVVDKIVVMIDKSGNITKSFANSDWYFYPYSVAMHGQCYYVTAMKGQVVIKYNAVGKEILRFGTGVLKRPTGVAVDNEGDIFVADSQLSKILVFSPNGKFKKNLETSDGTCPTVGLSSPWFIKFNKRGHLLIADFENKRVQVLHGKTGSEIMSIYLKLDGHDMYCRGVDVDRNDNIYVAARKEKSGETEECIIVYNPDGTNLSILHPEEKLDWVRGLHINTEGREDVLYIVNGGNSYSSSRCIRRFVL